MVFFLAACSAAAVVPTAAVQTLPDAEPIDIGLAAAVALPADAPPGLSGLGRDADGRVWAVAERDARAVVVGVDGAIGDGIDLPRLSRSDGESLAWLDDGRLAVGVEPGSQRRRDHVYLYTVTGGEAQRTAVVTVDYAPFGLRAAGNKGTEALDAAGSLLIIGSEMVVEEGGLRDAPLWMVDVDSGAETLARLRLSTETGKLAAIEAVTEDDGTLTLLAVERHFGVCRLLVVHDAAGGGGLAPERVIDLWPMIEGLAPDANLEGLALQDDGGLVLVSDNQYTDVTTAYRIDVAPGW